MNSKQFKNLTINRTLLPKTSLAEVFDNVGFIQADPIRSPARAQDLILRHRVKKYINGDLELHYPTLDLEEDFLYAYGFMSSSLRDYLYPRKIDNLTDLDADVLAYIEQNSETHPKDLESQFGSHTVINGWGGISKMTKRSLERLHNHGYLRVCRRQNGIRIYAIANVRPREISDQARKNEIVKAIVNVLEPVVDSTLTRALQYSRYFIGDLKDTVKHLLQTGELGRLKIDNINYIFTEKDELTGEHNSLKFLAPFDPLVWDRKRFEHLWGWEYRFEAYTPKDKRLRGYYSMPLLWRKDVIGWVNISAVNDKIEIEEGYVNSRPDSKIYNISFDKEVAEFEKFLFG